MRRAGHRASWSAFAAAWLLPAPERIEAIPAHQKSLYALGRRLHRLRRRRRCRRTATGFIAVFVCAIVLGIRRPDIREHFEQRADDLVEIVKLGIFVVFGSLLTFHGLFTDGWAAVALVAVLFLVARPAAIFIALAGTRVRHAGRRRSWPGSGPRAWRR